MDKQHAIVLLLAVLALLVALLSLSTRIERLHDPTAAVPNLVLNALEHAGAITPEQAVVARRYVAEHPELLKVR